MKNAEAGDDPQEGVNDFKLPQYLGPNPPTGEHRYVITVYALDSMIHLGKKVRGSTVQYSAMQWSAAHISVEQCRAVQNSTAHQNAALCSALETSPAQEGTVYHRKLSTSQPSTVQHSAVQ